MQAKQKLLKMAYRNGAGRTDLTYADFQELMDGLAAVPLLLGKEDAALLRPSQSVPCSPAVYEPFKLRTAHEREQSQRQARRMIEAARGRRPLDFG